MGFVRWSVSAMDQCSYEEVILPAFRLQLLPAVNLKEVDDIFLLTESLPHHYRPTK